MNKKKRSKTSFLDTWEGGYVRVDGRGRKVYAIQKLVGTKRFHVSTRCHSEEDAMVEWRRFQKDPWNYVPTSRLDPEEGPQALLLTKTEATELERGTTVAATFLRWSRDFAKNTEKWVNQQRLTLNWWAEQAPSLDLRSALLQDIEAVLGPELRPGEAGYHSRAKRIAVLKMLYTYLRTEKHARDAGFSITPAQDPVYGGLKVPQSDPDARAIEDKAFPQEDFLKMREHLTDPWRSAGDVLADTGWHATELRRFVREGFIDKLPRAMAGDAAGVLVCPRGKGGRPKRTPVGERGLAAGQLLRKRGTLDLSKLADAMKAACDVAGIKDVITPGRFRAAVATWALNAGEEPARVSAFLDHSESTMRKFYARFATPKKVTTLL